MQANQEYLQLIASTAAIIGAMYGMLKFMLKDVHKQVELLEKEHEEFKEEMRHTNRRMDGVYKILLDRTYGKNIPEELK